MDWVEPVARAFKSSKSLGGLVPIEQHVGLQNRHGRIGRLKRQKPVDVPQHRTSLRERQVSRRQFDPAQRDDRPAGSAVMKFMRNHARRIEVDGRTVAWFEACG